VNAARALLTLPERVRRGEVFEVRALIAHPMESGQRVDAEGRRVPRDIVRRFECRLEGALLFAADLHPAVAANPYLVFTLRLQRGGALEFSWRGDRGFAHRESAMLAVDD
jgi:sulfur-oxidizing protein SoxZ